MPINVTAHLTESLTAGDNLSVGATLIEASVGPFGNSTRTYGMIVEALVSPDLPSPPTSISLSIENNVNPTSKYVPLTGQYATEETITGWLWDRRRLENEELLQTQYDTYLGGHLYGLLDGTKLSHWESGTIRGCGFKDIVHYRNSEFLTWTPRVEVGSYSLHHDRRPLFSDYSYASKFSTDAIDNGSMWHALRDDAVHTTIDVCMYNRDDYSRVFRRQSFNRVDEFTGQISGGSRLSTVSGTDILWSNIETRKKEFIVKDSKVYLSTDWSVSVGQVPSSITVDPSGLGDYYEYAGEGVRTGRDIFCKNFPLQENTVVVISKDAADNTTTWIEQSNLNFSRSTDKHFSVDYDLGIITMGGFQAPDLTLSEDLGESDVEISVYIDDETMAQYPAQGIITIDSEEIAYYSKGRNTFYNIIRGYNNTTAVSHLKGSVVSDVQHGEGTSDSLYVGYVAVPRIEYEVTEYNLRSANSSSWLDVRPGINVGTHNIVQILSTNVNLAEVVLETDTALIGGETHGPLFYGTDVSRLTARGLDALGNPVENIDLTVEILSGVGRLNGASTTYTNLTNTLGEIYTYYNSPYARQYVEKTVSTVTHVGSDTQMVVDNLLPNTVAEDIWVFQILKHDKTLGTVGAHVDIIAAAATTGVFTAISPGYIDIDGVIDKENYRDGYLEVVGTDNISYIRDIVYIQEELDINDQPFSRVYMNNTLNNGVVAGQTARFFEPEATPWVAAALNGSRHILYEFRNDVEHPLTGELGAYYPLQPDSISGQTITFNGRNLALPDANDTSNNLGAYVVVAPAEVSLQAYGRDPVSGRVIRSNIIKLQLELPASLSGVDATGAIPVPHGFTFVTEEFNIGSAIGGSNFLTINPAASGINQFSLLGIFP